MLAKSLKIRAKSLKIWAKSLKIRTKLLNISAKSLKIWAKMAPNVLRLQKMAPNVCRKTSEDHVWISHHKTVAKSCATTYWAGFGKIWAKIFCTPKTLLAPTPMR